MQEGWTGSLGLVDVWHIEWINKVLLYKTRKYIRYPAINHSEKEYKNESIYVYNWITYCTALINTTWWINYTSIKKLNKPKKYSETSPVVQWIGICLPMQWTQVQPLVQGDPTCRGATKSVHHNYWACALEPRSHNYWAHMLQLLKPAHLEPVLWNKSSHLNEKPKHCN